MSSMAPSFPSYTCLLSFPCRLRSSVISSCCCRFPLCDGDWTEKEVEESFQCWSCCFLFSLCFDSEPHAVRWFNQQMVNVNDGGVMQMNAAVQSWSGRISPWCPPPAAPLAPFSQVTFAPDASFVRSPLLPADHNKTFSAIYSSQCCMLYVILISPDEEVELLTLYALMKRTKTGKKTEGGIVFELSPKNVTTSSNAS